ncbi:Choline-sulfatase [Sandaracinus amylolyticus]|uniref:Choline-sulfatase n=1 Tax=Sandaracinus amylolyticus TaxID=927083 RepID=A0A0F6SGH5_9BACT|nr:Choline-sulfatase [Sandaracinus amylolyticus]
MRLVSLLVLSLLVVPVARAQPVERPNVVLILGDDLGWGDLGVHGQTRIHTPRIDALAREGMRFTAAYAGAPVCAPSRCVLMTGLHAGHCPVGANQYPNGTLRIDEVTIADLLRGAGYHTAIAGKWGLGGELADGTAHQALVGPWAMGFDRSMVVLDQFLAADHWPEWIWVDGERIPLEGNVEDGRARWAPELFVEETTREIDRAARRGQPFFVVLATTLPHRELVAPDDGPYADAPWPDVDRAYAALVTRFDDHVGRIVDHVDALGLASRTLILVASDNGPATTDGHHAAFFASSGPFRGGKRDLTEGGIRVPLIARWPGVVPAGAVRDVPVGLVDLLPTLGELAGVGAPAVVDGASIARVLVGHDAAIDPRDLIWTCDEASGGPGEIASRVAVRRGSMKLIERVDGALELYDLASDPGEREDLADARPTTVRALHDVAEAETVGATQRVDPVLRVVGEGVRDEGAAAASRARPVLWARFDGQPASLDAPRIPLRGPARDGRFSRGAHLVAGPHAALAFGASSLTVEATLRLHDAPEGARWLVVAKPAGRDDRFVDFGVLARAGSLDGVRWMDDAGAEHGIAIVFGDRTPRRGAWGVRSTLVIDDARTHRVAVRVDHTARRVRFELDDRHEDVAIPARRHVVGEGLLHVGAHPGDHGALDGALEGELDELRISRGVGEPARDELAEAVLDLGRVVVGGPTITRRVRIVDASSERSRAMEGHVEPTRVADPRLDVHAPRFSGLVNGAGRGEIVVTLRPDHVGALHDQRVTIVATVARIGTPARRSPLVLRIRGEVVPQRALDGGVDDAPRVASCAISRSSRGGVPALVLLAALAAARARARRRRPRCASTCARHRDASGRATARRA